MNKHLEVAVHLPFGDLTALREVFQVRQRRVDMTIPASVGSVNLQAEGSRGLWLHAEGVVRSSAHVRLTPQQARLLASVLLAYADSHPDTEGT